MSAPVFRSCERDRVGEVVDELQPVLVAALRLVVGLAGAAGGPVDLRHAGGAPAFGVGPRRLAPPLEAELVQRPRRQDRRQVADDVLHQRVAVGAALARVQAADAVAGRSALVGAIAQRHRVLVGHAAVELDERVVPIGGVRRFALIDRHHRRGDDRRLALARAFVGAEIVQPVTHDGPAEEAAVALLAEGRLARALRLRERILRVHLVAAMEGEHAARRARWCPSG